MLNILSVEYLTNLHVAKIIFLGKCVLLPDPEQQNPFQNYHFSSMFLSVGTYVTRNREVYSFDQQVSTLTFNCDSDGSPETPILQTPALQG